MPDIVIQGWVISHTAAVLFGAAAMLGGIVMLNRSVQRRKGWTK